MTEDADLKAIDDEVGFAVLVRGDIKDEPFWAYVSVFPSKYEDFIAVQDSGEPYCLTDFGEIIEYKIGETDPPADVMKDMEDRYGIDHAFEDKIEKVAERAVAEIGKLRM